MKKHLFCLTGVLLSILVFANLCFPQKVEEILRKHKDALGGEENLMNIRTLFGKANIRMADIEGEMKVWWSEPDKIRQEFHFPLFGSLIVTDGESFWMQDYNGKVGKLVGYEGIKLLDELFLENYGYLFPEKRKERMNFQIRTNQSDPEYLVFEVTSQGGELKKLLIDESSYLIQKYQRFVGKESVTVHLNDYREVDGVMFPFRMHRTMGRPHFDTFVRFVEIVVNPSLPETLFVKPKGVGKGYRFVSNTGFIKVPFELVSNHIYLQVKVNDYPHLSFLLDTGAGSNYLNLSKAGELKIKKIDRKKARRVGGSEDVSFFKLDSIGIDLINPSPDGSVPAQNENLILFDQTLIGISLSQVDKFDGKKLDGILGYDFFKRFVVEIDYINQVLTISEPKRFNYTGEGEEFKINLEGNIPKIKAVVDGEHEGIFKIDTGSRNGVDLYAPFIKKHKFLEKYPKYLETPVGFGITGPIEGVVRRIKSFQLGSFLVKSPVTGFYLEDKSSFGSSKIAGKIGGGILKKFKVIFDYSHHRMILEKNTNYHLWDRYNTSGIQLIQDGKKILVYQVIKNSPAEEAKIKKDDEILSINQIPVFNYSLQKIREILNQEEGTEIELELKRKAKTKIAKLILKELI